MKKVISLFLFLLVGRLFAQQFVGPVTVDCLSSTIIQYGGNVKTVYIYTSTTAGTTLATPASILVDAAGNTVNFFNVGAFNCAVTSATAGNLAAGGVQNLQTRCLRIRPAVTPAATVSIVLYVLGSSTYNRHLGDYFVYEKLTKHGWVPTAGPGPRVIAPKPTWICAFDWFRLSLSKV
jgi:hypothetical protein